MAYMLPMIEPVDQRRQRGVEAGHVVYDRMLKFAESLKARGLSRLVFTACHPVLSTEGRVALPLRVLGGLATGEIARAFLVPEATIAQRIVRAKRTNGRAVRPGAGVAPAPAPAPAGIYAATNFSATPLLQ